MTKRISTLLLSLLLLFPFSACKKIMPTAPDDLPSIRKSTGGTHTYFATSDSNTALRLRMPMQWEFDGEDSHYTIKEDGATIGTLVLGEITEDADNMSQAKSETHNGVLVQTYTGVLKRNGEKAAWYRICYSYKDDADNDCTITFEIAESAMDEQAFKWFSNPAPMPIKDYHELPSISLNGGNGKKSIAILGNSFLYDGCSGIEIILKDMMFEGDRDCDVKATSIGYATIAKYAAAESGSNYDAAINKIKSGSYGIVFMCGLYKDGDVAAVQTIYNICQSSGTKLVLFPAHNEKASLIQKVREQYPEITLLNWKDELDRLMEAGVEKSDLCVNDTYGHSTALAGYVGAKMIYKSLFGVEPPLLSNNCTVIDQATVHEKLSGISVLPTTLIPEESIYRLKYKD